MEQAQKTIFDPAPFSEKPAEASGGGFLGFGGSVAFKLRRDEVHLHLEYDEHREIAYLQDYPISGQLEGLYDEIKANPEAEKKYFTTLYLGDWERKVTRVVKPVVNWPDPGRNWVGEPVAFLSAQIGYPNTEGVVQWDGHIFQRTDGTDAVWNTATEMKAASDVQNAPASWAPDKTFVKRQIHFTEPPSDIENPFVRVQIEKNVVDLDPGDLGVLVNDINLEMRVDNVGVLSVGPIFLNVDLENSKQVVEVVFKAEGSTEDGHERPPVKFSWQYGDQTQERYWMVYTGQPDFVPRFTYQVRAIVKGSLLTEGMEWIGPVQEASASGPLMVSVPKPDDPGVKSRSLVPTAVAVTTPPPSVAAHQPPARRAAPPPRRAALPPTRSAQPLTELLGWSTEPSSAREGQFHPELPSSRTRAEASERAHDTQTDGMFTHFSSRPPSE